MPIIYHIYSETITINGMSDIKNKPEQLINTTTTKPVNKYT